jgi:hypothetical protein
MATQPTTSPFAWTSTDAQKRAHALTIRATFAKKGPAKPASCDTCHLVHRGEC